MLLQIKAKHFCAGLVIDGTVVVEAAPILQYMVGWSRVKVAKYARRRKWDWVLVGEEDYAPSPIFEELYRRRASAL